MPRCFIGTLHSGEGDFDKCCKMLSSQENVEITHKIISNLPEKEAHNELWKAWYNVKQQMHYDVFVKVDADTVLRDTKTLFNIVNEFNNNDQLTGIQAPLMDYMTDQLINGLNCFGPTVKFNVTESLLYCDRNVDTGHNVVLRQNDLKSCLVPAGYHCYNSTDIQAFHYGVHRALKNQTHTILRVKDVWLIKQDRTRALALIGARMAENFNHTNHNYTGDTLKAMFALAEATYDKQIESIANSR